MPTPEEKLSQEFEKKHLRNLKRTSEAIRKHYEGAIQELSLVAGRLTYKGGVFELSKYPQLKEMFEKVAEELQAKVYTTVVNGIDSAWDLSNQKNDLLIDKRLAGRKKRLNPSVEQILFDPNREALQAFKSRKEKGLNLSDRVWNSLEPLKTEMEQGLGIGISEGKPAKELAKDLKKYLNQPDKLFRRVRQVKNDPDSKLRLSKAAQNYSPGQGVYRSSYKNALRLTRTETNLSYRSADSTRWATMPFVTGIEIRLSNNHRDFDICDTLAGKYPKNFTWSGWHPQCLCHQVPILASDEEYNKIEDAILAGEEVPAVNGVSDTPKAFKDYVSENKERIAGWKNQPYWAKDNPDYFAGKKVSVDAGEAFNEAVKETPVVKFTPAKDTKEALERFKAAGVSDAALDRMHLSHVNATLEAIETVPEKAIPDAFGNGAHWQKVTGRKIERKADEWYGVSVSYDKVNWETRQMDYFEAVAINTNGFKTTGDITAKKVRYNELYNKKFGREYFFNTEGRLTHFHELGHVYDHKSSSLSARSEWMGLAERWHKEQQVDVLKSGSEAFAEAFADYFGNGGKRLPEYIINFFKDKVK